MRSSNLLYTVTSLTFLLLPSSLNTGLSISVKLSKSHTIYHWDKMQNKIGKIFPHALQEPVAFQTFSQLTQSHRQRFNFVLDKQPENLSVSWWPVVAGLVEDLLVSRWSVVDWRRSASMNMFQPHFQKKSTSPPLYSRTYFCCHYEIF